MNKSWVKKIISIILFLILVSLIFLSCRRNNLSEESGEVVIYKGQHWDVVKINDTMFMAIPGLNASKNLTPIMFNIKGNTATNIIK